MNLLERARETSRYLKISDRIVKQRLALEDVRTRLDRMQMETPPSVIDQIYMLDTFLVRLPSMTKEYGLEKRSLDNLEVVRSMVWRMYAGETLQQIHEGMIK